MFDPERYASRLAPAGATLAVVGGCVGGGAGLLLAAVGVVLLLLACVSRRDGLLLFGPFVRAELVRAARTRRPWLWRAIYALAAGAILVGNVYSYAGVEPTVSSGLMPPGRIAYINEQVTNWFAVCLFGYVCVLTVQLMASVVAEEREARRWDDLLTTDLRAREILLGKAVGRLPLILDPVLAALPILALTPLLGGVSPKLLAGMGVAILAVIVGLGSVSLFYSVFAPTARAAIGRTLSLVFVYLIVAGPFAAFIHVPRVWNYPTSAGVTFPVEVGDVIVALNAGNPFAALGIISVRARAGPDGLVVEFLRAVRRFAAFQVGVFALFGLTAMARLRRAVPWDNRQRTNPATVVRKWRARPHVDRPPVGDLPVYWWQRYGSLGRLQLKTIAGQTPRRYLEIGLVALAVFIVIRLAFSGWKVTNFWQGITALTFAVMSLGVIFMPVFRAAVSVARERAAGTLDGIRLTALTPRDILYQKWLASVMTTLPLFLTLLTCSVAAVLTGFLHPVSLVGLAILLPVYSAAGAAVGLYFSVRASNSGRAVRNLILMAIVFGYAGSVLVTLPGSAFRVGDFPVTTTAFPPAATVLVLFAGIGQFSLWEWVMGGFAVMGGLLLDAGLGWVAWRAAVRRFEREWSGG